MCVCGGGRGGGGMVVGSVGRFWFYYDSVGLKLLHCYLYAAVVIRMMHAIFNTHGCFVCMYM